MAIKKHSWKVHTLNDFLEKHYSLDMQLVEFKYPAGINPHIKLDQLSVSNLADIAVLLKADGVILSIRLFRELKGNVFIPENIMDYVRNGSSSRDIELSQDTAAVPDTNQLAIT
jgi:hypothetical protein